VNGESSGGPGWVKQTGDPAEAGPPVLYSERGTVSQR
jgi:hypothetical protein